MDDLYRQYGDMMIQMEILQSKINIIKKSIADGINAANKPTAPAPADSAN